MAQSNILIFLFISNIFTGIQRSERIIYTKMYQLCNNIFFLFFTKLGITGTKSVAWKQAIETRPRDKSQGQVPKTRLRGNSQGHVPGTNLRDKFQGKRPSNKSQGKSPRDKSLQSKLKSMYQSTLIIRVVSLWDR